MRVWFAVILLSPLGRVGRELFGVPALVIRHARRIVLRLSPVNRRGPLLAAWAALQALPSAAGP